MPRISTIFALTRIFTRLGAAIALLFIFFLADNFISSHFTPRNVFRALPGTAQPISGELPVSVVDDSGLVYSADNRYLAVEFEEARGRLWRGRLKVDPAIQPGDYRLRVWVPGNEAADKTPSLRVMVFEHPKQLRASYPSLTRRMTGIAPMWMALLCLPVVVGALAGSYILSSRQEIYLERKGIVPIVRMLSRKNGWEIHFPLGGSHGVAAADELALVNDRFEVVGRIVVDRVDEDFGTATVPFNASIAPSWWIVRDRCTITQTE